MCNFITVIQKLTCKKAALKRQDFLYAAVFMYSEDTTYHNLVKKK